MQRVLVILTVILVVSISLGVGALTSHWPFWHRAWQWQRSPAGWPAQLVGPEAVLRPAAGVSPLTVGADPQLAAMAAGSGTRALVRIASGSIGGWFAPGTDAESVVDGRVLSRALQPALYAVLSQRHPDLLDAPVGRYLPEWREDQRGSITPRQLLWQLSGLPAGQFRPLNPFSARAQLASGPDFARAALRWRLVWPPGSHFEDSPVNAQLLAEVAARLEQSTYARVLEQQLWSRFAGSQASVMLDHRRGDAVAHCCLQATVADWVRLASLLLADGDGAAGPLWPPGFVATMAIASPVQESAGLGFALRMQQAGVVYLALESAGRAMYIAPATGTALLWFGEGHPPAGMPALLAGDQSGARAMLPVQ